MEMERQSELVLSFFLHIEITSIRVMSGCRLLYFGCRLKSFDNINEYTQRVPEWDVNVYQSSFSDVVEIKRSLLDFWNRTNGVTVIHYYYFHCHLLPPTRPYYSSSLKCTNWQIQN